jgi:hypothetical protein
MRRVVISLTLCGTFFLYLTGFRQVGELAGDDDQAKIIDSSPISGVSGSENVGGLVRINSDGG